MRATPPDRKPASAPSREDESFAGRTPERDAAAKEAANAAAAERNETQRRLAERAAASENQRRRAAIESEASSERETESARPENSGAAANRRTEPVERSAARDSGDAPRAEAPEASKNDVKAPPEPRPEDIKRLEQIRAEALYPSPPSAQSREIAQRAHTELIRAEAELRAYELEKSRQKAREDAIARFNADQAAEAYRQLEAFDGAERGLLH